MKSGCRFFILYLILLLPDPGFSQTDNNLGWYLVDSPLKSRLLHIKMLSRDQGFISGSSLLEYDGREWSIMKVQPPLFEPTTFWALDKNNVWLSSPNANNAANFFYYNGKVWSRLYSPLANQITSIIYYKDGSSFLGGDRELAVFRNNKWEFIEYPGTAPFFHMEAWKDRIWIVNHKRELLHYSGGKWQHQLSEKYVTIIEFTDSTHGFAVAGEELWEYKNRNWSFHSSAPVLKNIYKLFCFKNGIIWGCGNYGTIVQYNGKRWITVPSPVTAPLYGIDFTSEKDGWIIGENGIILKYGSLSEKKEIINKFGFQKFKTVPSGGDLDNEYGVTIEDFDNNGLMDIYSVCIYDPNKLYLNRSALNNKPNPYLDFREEAVYRNITGVEGDSGYTLSTNIDLSAGIADIDNDGDKDFFLCNLSGQNRLLLNNGKAYFRNVSHQKNRGTTQSERTNSAVFSDVDNDGDVDMFITNEYSTNRLYRNNGNGYFKEITVSAGLSSAGGSMCAVFADIDNDNDADLYVTNWAKKNILYRNDSNGGIIRFTDVTEFSGTGGDIFSKSNGLSFADIDNDGDLDLYVANRRTSNRLYLNNGGMKFNDVTDDYIGCDTMLSYSCTFADFDLDGYQDLYVTNVGECVLYKNIYGKKFIPVTLGTNAVHSGYCTGSASGDIDNDGDVDLYLANYLGGTSEILINNLNSRDHISVRLNGTKSCRDAIGAKVWLYKNSELAGYREVLSSSGYASQNSFTLNFGAAENQSYKIVVYFPASGIKRIIHDFRAPAVIIIDEEDGLAAFASLTYKFLYRNIIDPDVHSVILKSILLFILFGVSLFYGFRKYKWTAKTAYIYYVFIAVLFYSQVYLFFYEDYFLSTVLPVISVLVSLSTIHLIYERVILVRKTKLERQATRDAIARDLHDDLASTLSSSVIYTEALKRQLHDNKSDSMLLNKIDTLLNEASEAVTDIVWTVSPQHDTLDDLFLRLRILITDNCRGRSIETSIEDKIEEREIVIQDDIRRNIFLIFKEAANNIVKHSCATFVRFSFAYRKPNLEIILEDNGKGFIYEDGPRVSLHGHGLRNIYNRAREINCSLEINTIPGKGTRITLLKKMT